MPPSLACGELKKRQFWVGCAAELMATTLFVFLVCASTLGQPSSVSHIASTAGLSITTLALCIGHITGGQLNPVVPFALMATRKLGVLKGVFYAMSQFLGGEPCYTTDFVIELASPRIAPSNDSKVIY